MASVSEALRSAGSVRALLGDVRAAMVTATPGTPVTVRGLTLKPGGASIISRIGTAVTGTSREVARRALAEAVPGGELIGEALTPTDRGPMIIPKRGGSSGISATPQIPTSASGVLLGIGREILTGLARRGLAAPPPSRCPDGSTPGPFGSCLDLKPGGDVSGGGVMLSTGEVVKGRYGAAEVPEVDAITTRKCRRGLVLGDDNLCYRRGDLRKDERKWNPGRKPLFTGGEQNAVAVAARVAGKLQAHQSRLQRLGMLKRPKGRRQIELELRHSGKLRGR